MTPRANPSQHSRMSIYGQAEDGLEAGVAGPKTTTVLDSLTDEQKKQGAAVGGCAQSCQ